MTQQSPSVEIKPEQLTGVKFSHKVSTPLLLDSILYEVEILPNSKVYTQKTTLNFKNYCDKKLEGELVFPLPEEATICGYALQIDDDLVDATVVQKKKAQKVFDQEVRSGQTVSLIEKVIGNQYKTKIYPWEPNSTKTVRLEFLSDLKSNEKDLFFSIPVESSKHEKLSKISLLINSTQKPNVTLGDKKQSLTKKEGKYAIEFSGDDLQDLDILNIYPTTEDKNSVSIEKNTITETIYFNISDFVQIPNNEQIQKKQGNISIIWDSSLSREKLKFEKIEFQLLSELLSNGKFEIDLYSFSNTLNTVGTFEDFETLKSALKLIQYDGGTNIYQLNNLNLSNYDYCLLFTDGLDTLSVTNLPLIKFKSSCPIYCLNSSINCNRSYMNYICDITNGAFYQLNESNVQSISKKIGFSPYSFLSAEFNEDEISEVYPSKTTQLIDSLFHLNGILLKDEASIKLNFGSGKEIKETKTFKISKNNAVSSKIVGMLWAKRCLSEMECFSEHFEEEIISIGRQFSLVTKDTSLIVLENLDQHLKHNIVPSKTRKSLYDDYLKTMEEEQKLKTKRMNAKLEIVKGYWKEYMDWYNQDFVPKHLENMISQTKEAVEEQNMVKKEIDGISTKIEKLKDEYKLLLEKNKKNNELKLIEKKKEIEDEIKMLKVEYEYRKKEMERMKSETMAHEEEEKKRVYEEEQKKYEEERRKYEEIEKLECAKEQTYDEIEIEREYLQQEQCLRYEEEERSLSSMSRSRNIEENEPSLENDQSNESSSMNLKSWDPNVPYINELKKLQKDELYINYLRLRNTQGSSPAYYLDCCDFFFKQGLKNESLKILSNLSELEFDSAQLLRIIGYKLEEIGELDLSIQTFRKVLSLKPDEPQSYRDLGLVLEKANQPKEAIQLLYKVVIGEWSSKFSEIEITALQELNRCIDLYGDFNIKIPDYLRNSTPLDLRIIMAWDTDMVDIDLHTIEPNGEEVYYGHKRSEFGGLNSRDFTQGYGPETYSLKTAMPGVYRIKARYYSSHQQSLTGGTTILLTLFTKYGVKNQEKCQQITIRLSQSKQDFQVGEIEIKNDKITFIQNDLNAQTKELEILKEKLKEENQKYIEEETNQKKLINEEEEKHKQKIVEIQNNSELKEIQKLINELK
eukprot:gene2504-3210_t